MTLGRRRKQSLLVIAALSPSDALSVRERRRLDCGSDADMGRS